MIKKELRQLPELLFGDENLLALTRGHVDSLNWLMAITDNRIILLRKGLLFGHSQLEVPIAKIKSVSYKTGLMFGTIFIDIGAGTIVLEMVNKKSTPQVSAVIIEAMATASQNGASKSDESGSARKSAGEELVAQLERLASLKDRGLLSPEEFQSSKNKLISLNSSAEEKGGVPTKQIVKLEVKENDDKPVLKKTKPGVPEVSAKKNVPLPSVQRPSAPHSAAPAKDVDDKKK
ncbi:MAG: PH domain-containing protein [Deltaproteobacteria bacterium]|nr:PH domain-containing protein [Deltaproteobacteria bacterium]